MTPTTRATALAAALLLGAPAGQARSHLAPSQLTVAPTEGLADLDQDGADDIGLWVSPDPDTSLADLDQDGADDIGLWVPPDRDTSGAVLTGFEQTRSSGPDAEALPPWLKSNARWWVEGSLDASGDAEASPPGIAADLRLHVEGGPDAAESRYRPAPEAEGGVLSGLWVPRGRSGRRFLLILDDASRETLLARIADGAPVEGVALLGTPKILLKLTRKGGALLHVRARAALSEGRARVRYKARLSAAVVELP